MIPGVQQPSRPEQPVQVDLRRILLVDEALPVRRKLTEILHRAGLPGAQIRSAESAEAALERFALDHPNLVFAELVGPDPHAGLEMVLEMLAVDPQAKIVLVTAEDPESPLVRQAVRAGVFAVVRKPLRHEKIRQVLQEIESEDGGIERLR